MKFRRKMILAYATVALLGSLFLGIVVARLGFQYEMNTQKENLRVAAKSYVVQMDETLGRMDAIMHYILSDANLLDNITLLSKEKSGNIPNWSIVDAKSKLSTGLSTDYIMKNSYRTVFFNQNSFLASSAIRTHASEYVSVQRIISDFSIEELPYLERVIAANGETVIVPAHLDYWGVYNNVPVYSLMKSLRGEGMGFLEVECRMDSFDYMEKSDPEIQYLILVNGNELLYSSVPEVGERLSGQDFQLVRNMQENIPFEDDRGIYLKYSSTDYNLTVLAYKEAYLMRSEMQQFFQISFLIALVTFGASLLLVVFWAEILTRPVKHLQEIVENTNIENLQDNQQLEMVGAVDEFRELINAYQNMTIRLDKAVHDEKKATMLQLQSQFDMLQAQINPHFIYNVLNTISARAILDNDEVICEICGSLGSMLRYSTSSKERYASVKQELEYLENYFYLLKSRYEERLEVTIDVDEKIKEQIIPKMTLQQVIENSVKHGSKNMDTNIAICITGKMQDDGWMIQIKDNGKGISEERLLEIRNKLAEVQENISKRKIAAELEIGGMGIVNTYARCVLLYANDLIFEIENNAEGSGVVVTIGKNT